MMLSGFWRCCAIAGLTLLANSAFAQPPQEIASSVDQTIKLQPGETRTFRFDEGVRRIAAVDENVVEITPQSDRTFDFKGIASGKTVVTARSTDGRETHRLLVVVGGHLVKIYGLPDEPDYVGFACDEFGCDPGVSNKPKPNSQSVTVRTPVGGGGFVERTKNY